MARGSDASRREQWAIKRLKELKSLPPFLKTPEIRAQIARDQAALGPVFEHRASAAVSQLAHTLIKNGRTPRDAYYLARRQVAEAQPVQSSAASAPKPKAAAPAASAPKPKAAGRVLPPRPAK